MQAVIRPIRFFALFPEHPESASRIEEVVGIFSGFGPQLIPTRFGHCEPLRTEFAGNPAQMRGAIGQGSLLWRAPKAFVHVVRGQPGGAPGVLSVELSKGAVDQLQLTSLVRAVSGVLCPDFAIVHFLDGHHLQTDLASGVAVRTAGNDAYFGVTPQQLSEGLPGVYWGMLFGPPYCSLFGAERLLSTPVFLSEALGRQLVYLQLTRNILDVEQDVGSIDAARKRVVDCLGRNAFSSRSGLSNGIRRFLPWGRQVPTFRY